jgi:hypothetical protein
MEEVREPEQWKDIPGYEGLYQISSWGNVRSFDFLVNHYSGVKRVMKGRDLKLSVYAKNAYYVVVLCKDGLQKRFSVHLLVLECFIGKKPTKKHKGNHKDLNKLNNYYLNLEWLTIRENTTHYYKSKKTMSNYTGVTYDKSNQRLKRWAARISINNKTKNLGRFLTPEEAHIAYLNALNKYGIENKYAEGNQS